MPSETWLPRFPPVLLHMLQFMPIACYVRKFMAKSERTLSDIVNQAVLDLLREDSLDLDAVEKRRGESSRSFEEVLKDF